MPEEWSVQQAYTYYQQAVEKAQAGEIDDAIELLKRSQRLIERVLGEDHPDHMTVLDNLAQLIESKSDYAAAEPIRRRLVAISRRVVSEDHPDHAGHLVDLGNTLMMIGEYRQAADRISLARDIYLETVGENHPSYITALNALALIHHYQSDYAKAESLYRRAAELLRQVEQDGGSSRSSILGNLAALLTEAGKYAAAAEIWEEVLVIDRSTLGEDDPGHASHLTQLARLYLATGNLKQAETIFRKALPILRDRFGEFHLETQGCMNNLAHLLIFSARPHEAEPLLIQICESLGNSQGRNHPNYATALGNLGSAYQMMGRFDEAKDLFENSLRIHNARGEKTAEYVVSLNNLSHFYHVVGDYSSAVPLQRQALELRREVFGETHPSYAIGLNGLAALLEAQGDLFSPEPLYLQALEIIRNAKGERHPDYASILNNYAHFKESRGEYHEAELGHTKCLEIRRETLPPNHYETTTSLNNLAQLYFQQGNYTDAHRLFSEARDAFRVSLGALHPRYGAVLNNLAALHAAIGDYGGSLTLFEQALEIRGSALLESHVDVISNLSSLGGIFQSLGDFEKAEAFHERACKVVLRDLGSEHDLYGVCINNLAMLYESMRRYDEAEQLVEQALDISSSKLGDKHPRTANSLHNLANSRVAKGDYNSAEQLARRALHIRGEVWGRRHPHYAESLTTLAGIAVATGKPQEGLRLMEQVATIRDQTIGQIFAIGSERQRMAFLKDNRRELDAFLSLVLRHLPDSTDAVGAALNMVLRRKGLGAEALAAQRDAVYSGKYPALADKLKELNLLRRQIAQCMSSGADASDRRTFQAQLDEWETQKERIESELAREIPEIRLEQKLFASDHTVIARELPAGSVLVEFMRFDVFRFESRPALGESRWDPARYLAFVLEGGSDPQVEMIDLGDSARIDRLIAEFRDEITQSDSSPDREVRWGDRRDVKRRRRDGADSTPSNPIGAKLRAAILDPLIAAIGDVELLLIAPDGALTRLPFEILPTVDGALLTDRFDISYLSCGRDALRFRSASTGYASEAIVAANPDFDYGGSPSTPRTEGPSFSRSVQGVQDLDFPIKQLPATEVEGELIASRLGVSPWLGIEIREGRLKDQCHSPRILHLATHGYFLDRQEDHSRTSPDIGLLDPNGTTGLTPIPLSENPLLRAGIILSGVNTWFATRQPVGDAEDGLLTAEDVSGLDLLATELVVLSACDTGLGEVVSGEGVFGLQRAFVLAGTKTLVMSLWPVPDLTTALLMDRYYESLIQGRRGRAEALKAAQSYVRFVTIGEIRDRWLSGAMISRLARDNHDAELWYRDLAAQEDHRRPFTHPFFWGAFVCIGNPDPLSSS